MQQNILLTVKITVLVKYENTFRQKSPHMKKWIFLFFFAFNAVASAKTIYVATNGKNSNPGTLYQPFLTIQYAIDQLRAGDTLFIRGGIYSINTYVSITSYSGTATNPICVFAYPDDWSTGNVPIFDCSAMTAGGAGLWVADVNYWEFNGITVRNVPQEYSSGRYWPVRGVSTARSKYITYRNCVSHNNGGGGFRTGQENTIVYFYNCDVYNCADSLSPDPGNGSNGFGAIGPVGEPDTSKWLEVYYHGCRSWNNADGGFSAAYGIKKYVADSCWSFNHGYLQYGAGRGFLPGLLYYEPPDRQYEFRNCISANNTLGFNVNSTGTPFIPNIKFYNNTSAYDDIGFAENNVTYKGGTVVYKNNIAFPHSTQIGWSPPCAYARKYEMNSVTDHNSWDTPTGVNIDATDFVSVMISELSQQRKSNGSLPDINFAKLISSSDLINKGTDVGIAYEGTAPDLGAFEYSKPDEPSLPGYVNSFIESATPSRLEMIYNLSLANIIPAISTFPVRVNSVTRNVIAVAISGTKVILTLSSPVVYGDVVTVAYTKPASNPLQTVSGSQVASFTAKNVTNNVLPASPVYLSSAIENGTPSRMDLTYNLSLANIVPATSAFTVTVNSSVRSISSVAISGAKVLINLSSSVVYGDVVTIAYTKPSVSPLQTASGGQAVSLNAQSVTNNVVPVSPVYVSSVVENATPSRLDMTYNLPLANIIPVASVFTVNVNSSTRSVSSVAISGTKVILTLSSPVVCGDVVTVAYTKPASNPLQTVSGAQATSITPKAVINNCTPLSNQRPVINISSPGKSSSFTAPATITFDASASDPDGLISKVEFFNGNNKLAEITTTPYSYTWKDVPAGTYSITAVATDNRDGKGTSEAILVIVNNMATAINQLPVVNITSPCNNGSFKVPVTITLTANATDPDGSINKVEYFNGNIKIGESFSSPYSFPFDLEKPGSFEITAIAYDDLNGVSLSSPITLYAKLFNENSDIINMYPNPNDGRFTLDLKNFPQFEENVVTIVDLTGKIIYKRILPKSENISQFDLFGLDSGVYILMITSNEIIITKKFIKT